MSRTHIIYALSLLALLTGLAPDAGAQRRVLSDDELDQVSAGGISVELVEQVLKFEFQSLAGRTHEVSGSGTIETLSPSTGLATGTLTIQDAAQSNLRSLININAVNSQVQVLVNLNINIDSVVEGLEQINLSGFPSP
jgi:DUF1680 family protein